MNKPDFLSLYFLEKKHFVEESLKKYCNFTEKFPYSVSKAMEYSLMSDAKRIRPILSFACCEAVGGDFKNALIPALSIECIHTYSLIHDDLPAMDNDDFRRGKPSCHKAFNEAVAILAGDGLLTYAFSLVSSDKWEVLPEIKTKVTSLISDAAGFVGMVGGQALELEESEKLTTDYVKKIYELKTGKLIWVSCLAGATVATSATSELKAISEYGKNLGLAFQLTDDILDDGEKNKKTLPALIGIEDSKKLAVELCNKAKEAVSIFSDKAKTLYLIADYIASRKK